MTGTKLFAQSTVVPNGASNSEDFQPPTRNPQQPVNTQQQSGGVQDPSGQDILNNPNARITVTKNPADPEPPITANAGINWLPVIVIAAVLVVVAEMLIRRREKRKAAPAVVKTAPAADAESAVEERVKEMMEPVETTETTEPEPAAAEPEPKKPAKKATKKKTKSKSKRKKK